MVISSAKRRVESSRRTLERSFMKAEKSVGPRTEPCGTPEVGKPGEEVEVEREVTWVRSEIKD